MTLSHWAGEERRAAYRAAYDASLALWPTPFESRDLRTPCGTTHVIVSGHATGEPVVLLHAASLSAVQWHPQAAALGATHRLFAADIPGDIGLSIQARPLRTRAEAAAWLAQLLDALGLERAIFVGSSFGGFLATNLALLQPRCVRGLVLLAPAATFVPFALGARWLIRLGGLMPLPWTVEPGLRGMMDGALPDERIVRQMEAGVAGFRYDRAGLFPCALPADELGALGCPTLVVVGEHERIYDPRRAVARAGALIRGAEVVLLPGLGHLPGVQRPEVVNPLIVDFLRRRLPPPA